MRFNIQEPDDTPESRRSPTTKEAVRWVPLQSHPDFASLPDEPAASQRFPRNFMAWDGEARLYYWDSRRYLLHRLSLRLGEPEPTSVLAAVPSKVMQPDLQVNFSVEKISINKSGSAVILAGADGICVMYLFGRASVIQDNVICRVVSIGSEIYSSGDSAIHLLPASWHPDCDTHLGVLSSDAVLRLFDFSSDAEIPEQEYYLQPAEPGRSRTASSIYPADFSFGGDHLCAIWQGPLYKASTGEGDEDFTVREAECKGRAVSLLYNLVSKDSILVTAWSGGQLQVDALVDEIQPVWISGSSSRLRMNSQNKIQGVAMICESNVGELPGATSNLPLDHTVWLGHPPPLLRLAMVDLALPKAGRWFPCYLVR